MEVSLVTLVQITEEKEPEKVSSPALDAPIQILPQSDQEVESVLDTELLDTPGTQMDSLKDELGSGEQEGEIPQQEIIISTIDYQVSTEPTPDSSILASTLPPNEKQPKAELLGHIKEFQEPIIEQIYNIGSLGNTVLLGERNKSLNHG
jgi:hypothetical protein